METLLTLLIGVIIIGLVCWLLWWLIDFIGLPEPFNKVAKVLIALIAVIYLLAVISGTVPALPAFKFR